MRITTQMLNKTAQDAGMPIHNHSLLDYVKGGNASTRVDLSSRTSGKWTKEQKTAFEKQAEAASRLGIQSKKFTAEEEDSLFAKAASTGDTTELCTETEMLAKRYNELLADMKNTSGTLNEFYKKSLKDLAYEYREDLEKLGITISNEGELAIDKEKLKNASLEMYEKVLGEKSIFPKQLSFLSSRIMDHASANLENLSGSYLPNGNTTSSYTNTYDFRG